MAKDSVANDKNFQNKDYCEDECPPQDFEENFDENEEFFYDDNAQEQAVLDEKDFDIPDENMLPKGELTNSSKRRIWGELALKLREMSCMTLHSACTEVHDLALVDGVLTAYVKDEFTLKILTEKENFDKISLVLKQIDDRISLQVVLKKPQNNKIVQNLQILKNLFGDDLIIK